jgi:Flp pilus assembly protein TadG
MLMLFFVSDAGKIWIARIELENALEAAALAGVRTWGEASGGPTAAARAVAIEYASVNTVDGQSLTITSNLNVANPPNENASTTGNLVFGSATPVGTNWIFDSGTAPDCGANRSYAIRAQAKAPVTSFSNGFLGLTFGPYEVQIETTVIYQCGADTPRIVASP